MENRTPKELLQQGREARQQHRLHDARSLYRAALEECGDDAHPRVLATLHAELGAVERALHESIAAEFHYRHAAEIFRRLDEPLKSAHALRHVADILRAQQKPSEALYSEAIGIYRENPAAPPLDLANALRGLALVKGNARDLDGALQAWEEARALYEQEGVEAGVTESQAHIAELTAQRSPGH